jgi:hypothetical protein
MLQRRRSLCALAVFAALAAPVLSGCASSEGGSSEASESTPGGASIAQLAGQLEGEHDEAELKEIVDRETTPEERQELREGLEERERGEEAQERGEEAQEQGEEAQEQGEAAQEQGEASQEHESAA